MAVINCKNCGGSLQLSDDKTIGTCDFCGSTMTFPKVDDEQRAAMFNRGNHFRRIGEFDKALQIYEHIVRDSEQDAEAHWCCALCRFGIEYVEDPATYEWLPTCHRASFDSFLEDVDYKAAVEYSDGITRRQYLKEGNRIAEVQRGILAASQNSEPYDIFICYKESDADGQRTRDSLLAQDIYYQLTEQGRKVFFARITLEDVAGTQYEPYIFAALNSARVMIVVGTKPEHLNAVWVKNEWSRFLAMMKKDRHKLLLPCYRDMDPYDMPDQLSMLQSYDMSKIGFLQDLIRGVSKVLDAEKKPEPAKETVVVSHQTGSNASALLKRGNMALEDGEWTKADEFFEEVLNQNAESAEAYIGKALAQEKCPDLQRLVDKWLREYAKASSETITVPENTKHIQQAVDRYEVPGYLSREEIKELYRISLNYTSTLNSRKQQQSSGKAAWNSHKLLTRATQFAQGETAKQLQEAKSTYFAQLDARVEEAGAQQTENEEKFLARYEAHLLERDAKAEALRQEAAQRRHTVYESRAKDAEVSDSIFTLERSIQELTAMGNYLDSEALVLKCRERVLLLRQAQEQAEKEKEARRHAQAVAAAAAYEAGKKRSTRRAIITVSAIAAAILFLVLLVKVIIPQIRYNKAGELFAAGQYPEAAEVYAALEDYKDSQGRSNESRYRYAETLMKEAQYPQAILYFQELGEYKDSFERILECNYLQAEAFFAAGDDYLAATLFGKAGTYKDAWQRSRELWDTFTVHNTLCTEGFGVFAVRENGTIAFVNGAHSDLYSDDIAKIANWTEIVSIAQDDFLAGLREDGTVVLTGDSELEEITGTWTGVVAIAASYHKLYALLCDGTVISTARGSDHALAENVTRLIWCGGGVGIEFRDGHYTFYNRFGREENLDTRNWTDVVMLNENNSGVVALRADGTVLYERNPIIENPENFTSATAWENIIAISADSEHLVGLKADGTAVAVGGNYNGRLNVGSWNNIVAIDTSLFLSVGLRSDGTVVCTDGDVQRNLTWNDIRLPE